MQPNLCATRPGQYHGDSACRRACHRTRHLRSGRKTRASFFVTGSARELAELRPEIASTCLVRSAMVRLRRLRATAIVAGGVGLASVLLPAQWLRAGARVRLFCGARSAKLLVDAKRFSDAVAVLFSMTTDRRDTTASSPICWRAPPAASSRSDLGVRPVADAARGRTRCRRTRRSSAAEFGRNVRVRRRRMLGMRCPARTESAQAPGSRTRRRRQRRRQRAHL